ncbi:MAG: T9SS type A sorting domain-containing protein [Candidatus Zixiibacteriota bacterium]|nr:MAG: T9SS type A sorting domain-containing protein [candidate division Zixibacteria bacterium]
MRCGGGIYCKINSNPLIKNNIIVSNWAEDGGGGVSFCLSNPTFVNNVVYKNSTDSSGGGLYLYGEANPYVFNNIFWDDSSATGEEISIESGTPVINYCNIQDTLWPGIGNISVDPLFRNPDSCDFHLMATYCGDQYDSPCIDAGHPDSVDNILDCQFGLGGPRSDMGAYGGNNGDWPTGIWDDFISENKNPPQDFFIEQNYPNPFNASTTIRFFLIKSANVNLAVYDLLGRKIRTLLDGRLQAGLYSLIWDAENYSSGTYFYTIRSASSFETKKMILIK